MLMKDESKTRKQLIEELEAERKKTAGVDLSGGERQLAGERVRQAIWRMETSEDTERLLQAIYLSLQALEIPLMHLGVNVIDIPERRRQRSSRTAWRRRGSGAAPKAPSPAMC